MGKREARSSTRPRKQIAEPRAARPAPGRRPTKLPLSILYEDEALIALDKPSGLLVIPDRFDPEKPTLFDAVWYHLHQAKPEKSEVEALPRLVHRLDRDTSGVVILAKSYEAQRALSRLFEAGEVEKRYLALVVGVFYRDSLTIDQPLAPLRKKKGLMAVDPLGKPSQTRIEVIERMSKHTLLRAIPQTGRQHQIRVHLAFLGYPLAFDPPYRRAPAEPEISAACPRLTLHAAELRLPHPMTKEPLTFSAPLPEDLARAIAAAHALSPA